MVNRKGAALLVVLFIIMTITILAVGFLSRSDVELACGQNMMLRAQMDYLAESGLQHAKGLILNPQDVGSEYWAGAAVQQLAAGSEEYYDVTVVRDDSDRCNYIIDCNSYRLKGGEQVGLSCLTGQLRLDPCIALWTGADTTLWSGFTVEGDIYCDGKLVNNGVIDGDVFADALTGSITGRHKTVADLSLVWPQVRAIYFIMNYATEVVFSGSLSGVTVGSLDPVRICHRTDSLTLAGDVQIDGMLIVNGDLKVQGDGNIITAAKNLPALYVSGDLEVEGGGSLQINGLAVVNTRMLVNGNASDISILGGLFVKDILTETTADSSVNGNTGILYNNPIWRPSSGKTIGALEFDGIDDYVRVPDDPSFDIANEITVTAWINPTDAYAWRTIVAKFAHTPAWRKDLYWFLRRDRIGASLAGPCGIEGADWRPDVPIQTGQWTHVALSYDGSTMKMYKYGADVATKNISGKLLLGDSFSDESFYIAKNTEWGEYFNGMIDDVRIYNRALDANDIYPPVDGLPGLVGHWRLDEVGSGPINVTAAPAKAAVVLWSEEGVEEKWGQAAGAFFRSVGRR